jgi:hypothetical protein
MIILAPDYLVNSIRRLGIEQDATRIIIRKGSQLELEQLQFADIPHF